MAYDGKYDRTFLIRVLLALLPPLTLIFLVLGSIITGIATVNQAGGGRSTQPSWRWSRWSPSWW